MATRSAVAKAAKAAAAGEKDGKGKGNGKEGGAGPADGEGKSLDCATHRGSAFGAPGHGGAEEGGGGGGMCGSLVQMRFEDTDNKALFLASEKAKKKGVPLVTLFVVSPQDWEAHLTAPVRVDFILRTLAVLKADLAKLDIPLHVEVVEKRRDVLGRISTLLGEWGAKHLFANVEYEVDELRREAKMVRDFVEGGVAVDVVHDTCVVNPGELVSGQGKPYAVYSPWFRSWVAHLHENGHLLDLFAAPGANPSSAREKIRSLV
ncbi:hypothetical protein EYC84_003953 [Monilinia fructicola]|uniref:Photolyase/cryptochrome alpha/beta domain-containing protein n=1 Tax=Monilinia fructicola TaxID=38448 RepID=A0A5M9K1P8_MONFR|nr:hypothetical protein EYC84_003953 [Monilinia fructicola]